MAKHGFNIDRGERRDRACSDESLGLTEAFSPIGAGDAPAGGSQADGDVPLGLTEAFAPLPASHGAHAGGFSYKGDTSDEYGDALDALEPRDEPVIGNELPAEQQAPQMGKHGRVEEPAPTAKVSKKASRKARRDAEHPYMRKSRRVRKVLIVVIVLLVALICAFGYFAYQLLGESQRAMVQQTQTTQPSKDVSDLSSDNSGKDAPTATATKQTEVPNLAAVLGTSQDEAVAALKHGATVTSSRDVNEEGNAVKKSVTVALTAEPADSRSGTPTVYLGLNEEGKVIQAGYSAATASLGYGTLSFADAVRNEHVVEKTLREAGVNVADGAAVLPADKTQYSTYATDGTTLVKENCSFSGNVDINGTSHAWSSVLLYDYSTANTSGNLADTIRIIYVYVNA